MLLPEILICLGVGVVSGIVAALCGVGGGVVMVPAFVFLLAMPQRQAVATSLAIIIPTALMATTQNSRHGLVNWKVMVVTSLSAALFAYYGSGWLKTLSNETLTRILVSSWSLLACACSLRGRRDLSLRHSHLAATIAPC